MKKRIKKAKGCNCNLSELLLGQKARVVAHECGSEKLSRRLLDMGITEGVEISIKKVAPFGDPIDIELRGYQLCIRRADLENVLVEVMI